MSLEIKYIKNNGSEKEERVVFKVLKDCDIGYYIVFDTTYVSENIISNKVRHSYWFPDKLVSAGDLVVLYTKVGTNTFKVNKDGTTTHFFYWDLDRPVLNNDKDCVVLVEANTWDFKGTQ